mmetsp:Transcript_21867/g.46004  ORF Transcript_21867/g.46004 Transcript_21867/m.46004 type:complete len:355 (+) Transcript_21867:80-1144(+)
MLGMLWVMMVAMPSFRGGSASPLRVVPVTISVHRSSADNAATSTHGGPPGRRLTSTSSLGLPLMPRTRGFLFGHLRQFAFVLPRFLKFTQYSGVTVILTADDGITALKSLCHDHGVVARSGFAIFAEEAYFFRGIYVSRAHSLDVFFNGSRTAPSAIAVVAVKGAAAPLEGVSSIQSGAATAANDAFFVHPLKCDQRSSLAMYSLTIFVRKLPAVLQSVGEGASSSEKENFPMNDFVSSFDVFAAIAIRVVVIFHRSSSNSSASSRIIPRGNGRGIPSHRIAIQQFLGQRQNSQYLRIDSLEILRIGAMQGLVINFRHAGHVEHGVFEFRHFVVCPRCFVSMILRMWKTAVEIG